ncbi:MAG: TlpA disulfide reductase family protein [Flavobacteriaceae bacterium]|nr:TlpA disulfide reductase family protein [Flavobacteriaceae bacterium]
MNNSYAFIFFIALLIIGCQNPKDHVELSGKIIDQNSDSIVLSNSDGYRKVIEVSSDGTFSDTLKVEEGRFRLYDGNEYGTIFLKNGNSTSFTLDTKAFDETLKFEGDDADKSNVLIAYNLLQEKYLDSELLYKTPEEVKNTFNKLKADFESLKLKYPYIDSTYFAADDEGFDKMKLSYLRYYENQHALKKELAGKPSPAFTNYENFKGGTSSLKDFRGKYVYIDVWATWCGPCKIEIPFLKELEAKFHNRNIEFISISVDDARRSGTMDKAYKAWRTMVADKNLTGTQLITGNGWDVEFIKKYKIDGIPRFILIDPKGNIIDPDAPRPSSAKLTTLLEELGV